MSLDLRLLQVMKYRQEFTKLYPAVPETSIDSVTTTILKDFKRYFEVFDTHDQIDMALFIPRFEQWHKIWNPDRLASCINILKLVNGDVDQSTRDGIASDLYEYSMATNIYNAVSEYTEGTLKNPLMDIISTELDRFKLSAGIKTVTWNNTPISELLQEDVDNSGLRWRLDCINEACRPLRPGDFGIIAARPDKGKTTFMASEITFMASQLPEDKNVLWLNNEGMSGRIRKRIFQAALDKSIPELIQMSANRTLEPAYAQAVGRMDKIRVFDIHDFNTGQVDVLIERNNPGIIIYDMIDNIRGFGSESRTDLQLECMYQWGRERAVKYQCVGIASSQISSEGEGLQYPTMSMLKDSKTGKQGACDFLLMIGHTNTENLSYARYIGMPKNKLRRDGAGDPHTEVIFDKDKARFVDIT